MATKQEIIDEQQDKLNRLETESLTRQHIDVVRKTLNRIAFTLIKRGENHDSSKLEEPEISGFSKYLPRLRDLQYGTDEYKEKLLELKETIQRHYNHSRHHPEYFCQSEIWKPIKDYEDRYEVSNTGKVRSLDCIAQRSGPTGFLQCHGQLRVPHLTPAGYLRLQLQKNGQVQNKFIHRLVAEAFIPNTENKPFINHKDSNRKNNHVNNLEWVTACENNIHAWEYGKQVNTKYLVYCPELDITTFGTQAMEDLLRSKGYPKAKASGIWRCINSENNKHLDLSFIGTTVLEVQEPPDTGIQQMNLIDIVEMFIDWIAACQKHGDNIRTTIEINLNRFHIEPQLAQILRNTITFLEEQDI